MHSRCKWLCGEDRRNCFISNRKQIACIADIVINKISGLFYILQILKGKLSDEDRSLVERVEGEINALVDWIRFLEISADLREAIKAYRTYPNDRRKELRFPVNELLEQFIALEVEVGGFLEKARLLNVSNRGVLFRVSSELTPGTLVKARLVFTRNLSTHREFYLTIKHCRPQGDSFIVGAEVRADETGGFKLFGSIYEYLKDIIDDLPEASDGLEERDKTTT